MTADLVAQLAAFEQVLSALAFYAEPDTYFAIAIWPDPPCGDFMQDFSGHGNPDYPDGDQRPGMRAREALRAWSDATALPLTDGSES
jgi:hypothetical protein